jgi:hypothetical protein
MLAVRNLLGAQHDLWNLNDKDVYLEQICAGEEPAIDLRELSATQPLVPSPRFLTSYGNSAEGAARIAS